MVWLFWPGIEDRPGARPGLAAVGSLGKPGRAAERVSIEGRIRAVARGLEPVPHDVSRTSMDWVRSDRLLVVEEVGDLEDGVVPWSDLTRSRCPRFCRHRSR